jgi:tRNA A37 threonylcarbamoyladenosine synthetase subunit TsaC/SUA5/YrdC
LTIVAPARPEVPEQTRAGDTVALRVPGLAALRALIRAADVALIGTSANRSGEPAALTAQAAAEALGRSVALVLDGGPAGGRPSTIVAVTGARVQVLRAGAISAAQVAGVLQPLGIRLEGAAG